MGTVLHLEGRVWIPVAGLWPSAVEIWRWVALGIYDHPRQSGRERAIGLPRLRRMLVDAEGRYRFRTLKPVAYPGRTPHIHFKVATAVSHLTSQFYIAGEARTSATSSTARPRAVPSSESASRCVYSRHRVWSLARLQRRWISRWLKPWPTARRCCSASRCRRRHADHVKPASTKCTSPVTPPRSLRQIERRTADMVSSTISAQRRGLVPFEHHAGIADRGTGQGAHRPGRDRVNADSVAAEIGGEIAHAGFQRRLGHAHHIVVGHHALGAEIGQRHHGAALLHQVRRALRHRGEGIAGDVEGAAEIGAAGIDIAALQFVAVGEGDGMDEKVEAAPIRCLRRSKHRIELGVVLDIGAGTTSCEPIDWASGRSRLAWRIALIGEGDLGTMRRQHARDAPGDGMVVGDAHHQAPLALHQSGPSAIYCPRPFGSVPVPRRTASGAAQVRCSASSLCDRSLEHQRRRWCRRSRSCWRARC